MNAYMQRKVSVGDTAIVARFFRPEAAPRGAVLLVPAMGVAQDFYTRFAEWLSAHGYVVATFDYRGMGLSAAADMRQVTIDILDWARDDCAAMIDAVCAEAPGVPLFWVGHSLGGQILPFVPNRARIAKAVAIAAGSGYWRENAAPLKRKAWFFWFFAVPVAVRLFGYFPGGRLGMVGDLPLAVVRQWKRWCMHPEYAVGAEGERARELYAAVDTPIVSLSFTDDEMMSARNTESMLGFYSGAPVRSKRLAPADIGERRIGHFGFFRSQFADSLWRSHLLPELTPEAGSAP